MRGLKSMRLVAVGAAVALASTACGGGTGSTDAGGGTLVFALHEPEHLIPGNTNETQGGTVLQVLYDNLVDYNDEGEPVNQIAEDISSEDQKTWTIKIKKGWKFHNGEPVTADSFIDAWNFTAYGPNANGNSYFMDRIEGYADLQVDGDKDPKSEEMSGLKKIDDQTFEVSLAEPFSGFPLMVGYTAFAPMAKECLEDTKACEEKPIGTGPFKMDGSWEHDRSIKMKRFEDYAGEAAKLDKIEFRIFKDEDAEYQALQSREVDMIPLVPVEKMGEVRSQFGERFIEEPNSTFSYLGFPTYLPEFKDKRIRQAFSMAIDRKTIVKEIFDDRYALAGSLVSPVVPGSRDDACKYCEYDPERAKELLKEAGGWPKGKKMPIWFNAGSGHEEWVEA
ncbi:MAG: peptide ABC transporter substrate-binding protein, partial [Micromonosporaceae bacterium]